MSIDAHAVAVLALTVLAFAMYASEKVSIETTSFAVLVALSAGFQLFPHPEIAAIDFFRGFGHDALVAICALMILGRGLVVTGALEPAARVLARMLAARPGLAMLGVLLLCAVASGVINDTPLVVLMLPVLVGAALRAKTSPARTLMPMNFAVLIGGMGTTIGTSTNLIVVAIATDLGVRRFEIFDFIHVTALAAVGGILYLWLVLPRLLPERTSPLGDAAPQVFAAALYVAEEGYAVGKTLSELREKTGAELRITRLVRDGLELARLPTLKLRAGDRLYLSAGAKELQEISEQLGVPLHSAGDAENLVDEAHPLTAEGQRLAEVVVTEGSVLHKTTLRATRFSDFHDVSIVGLQRAGAQSVLGRDDIGDAVLRAGDVLLVQGSDQSIAQLRSRARLLVLDWTYELPRTKRAPLALLILAAVVVVASLKLAPISIAALAGVAVMLATRCMEWSDASAALSAKIVLLVASSLALGSALAQTGATGWLAAKFVAGTHGLPSEWVLALLMLMVAAFTNFVSNAAAAAVGTPIAVGIAAQLGVSPEPLVLAVMFGANFAYATPMAYQTNLLVMSAAGYRFSDFVRGGLPLLVIMLVSYSLLLPRFFPL